MGGRALQFLQATVIMQTRSMNHAIVFYSRGYITFLGCQRKYLREQRIIAAHTGFNCWRMLRRMRYLLIVFLTGSLNTTVAAGAACRSGVQHTVGNTIHV